MVEELNSSEGAIVGWEDGLVTSNCAHGMACLECDAECT
jgi:hypothetical protein